MASSEAWATESLVSSPRGAGRKSYPPPRDPSTGIGPAPDRPGRPGHRSRAFFPTTRARPARSVRAPSRRVPPIPRWWCRTRAFTCLLVGTTTMKFGVARHGPSAPSTSQLGKYDVLTITGTPVRDTSNSIEVSVVRMLVTVDLRGGGPCHRARRRLIGALPGCRAAVGERPVERGGIVEPRHGRALPRAELDGAGSAGGLRSAFALPVGVGMKVVDHDRLVAQR